MRLRSFKLTLDQVDADNPRAVAEKLRDVALQVENGVETTYLYEFGRIIGEIKYEGSD